MLYQMKEYAKQRNSAWKINESSLRHNKELLKSFSIIWKTDTTRLNILFDEITHAINNNNENLYPILKKKINQEMTGIVIFARCAPKRRVKNIYRKNCEINILYYGKN